MFKVQVQELARARAQCTVIVSAHELIVIGNRVYERLSSRVMIPGFRPGKAPKLMIVEQLGRARINNEVLNEVISQALTITSRDHGIKIIGQPSITLKYWSYDPMTEPTEELIAVIEGDYLPANFTVKTAGVKLSATLKKELSQPSIATTQEIKRVIDRLRQGRADLWEKVEPIACLGDWVEVSIRGAVNGVEKEDLVNLHYPTVLGSGALLPEIEKAIVDMRAQSKKTIELVMPKDLKQTEYQGQPVRFTIELHGVKQVILPPLNDQFASNFGLASLEQLKESIVKTIVNQKQLHKQERAKNQLLEQLLKKNPMIIPETLIVREIDRLLADYHGRLTKMGARLEQKIDDLKSMFRPVAEKNLQIGLLLRHLAEQERIDPNQAEATDRVMDKLMKFAVK